MGQISCWSIYSMRCAVCNRCFFSLEPLGKWQNQWPHIGSFFRRPKLMGREESNCLHYTKGILILLNFSIHCEIFLISVLMGIRHAARREATTYFLYVGPTTPLLLGDFNRWSWNVKVISNTDGTRAAAERQSTIISFICSTCCVMLQTIDKYVWISHYLCSKALPKVAGSKKFHI